MLHPRTWRGSIRPVAAGLLVPVVLALVFFASCNDPQSPASPQGDATFRGLYDPNGGDLEFRIETPNGNLSALRLVASDLVFDAGSQQLHAQVAIRNSGNETVPGPNAILIDDIVPESVVPVNALPVRCPIPERCIAWEFIHQGTYGEDGILAPGETSSPIEWIFADPTGESFSFRALLRPGEPTPSGVISGSVFADANGDGLRQPFESGLPGQAVSLIHGSSTTTNQTDSAGEFEFHVEEAGLYEVVREATSDCNPTNPSHRQVFIVTRPDSTLSGVTGIAFGCASSSGGGIVVAGIVYEDLNRDGNFQDGEPGLAGVLITGGTPCPTFAPVETRTDENGHYALQLPACPPPYVISREVLPGYFDTSPNPVIFPGIVPDPPIPAPPPDPPVVTLRANFGVARAVPNAESSVEGVVFLDTNNNGQREDDERGLPGVEVTASGIVCLTPVIGVTHTDEVGYYILRQSDVHCSLPWRVAHGGVERMCDTSPNPVDVGYDRRPDPRHYRVDFGVAPCDSLPTEGLLVVFVQWEGQGVADRRLEIVELHRVEVTNSEGLARFGLPAGNYTLHADVNTPGPPRGVDLSVAVRRGQTTRVEVVDCLPCVRPD